MRALMIFNPTASAVTSARLRVVERALEATFDLDVVTTTHRRHAIELAGEAAAAGAKAVISLGGDGTVNEVVNGLIGSGMSTDIAVGVLPGGGTNVLARALGYPNELVEATGHLLDLVEASHTRRIGLGRMRVQAVPTGFTRLFTHGCGLGLDAAAVSYVESSGLRQRLGDLAFVYGAFRGFRKIRSTRSPQLRVETPAGSVDAWWVTVGNGDPMTYWGGRALHAHPRASYDEALDVLAARSARLLRTLRWAAQAFGSGRHVEHRDISYVRDVTVSRILARSPQGLQADGEFLGMADRVDLDFLPDAVPMFAVR